MSHRLVERVATNGFIYVAAPYEDMPPLGMAIVIPSFTLLRRFLYMLCYPRSSADHSSK